MAPWYIGGSMNVSVLLRTVGLLMLSNGFMLFAWYGHLKTLGGKPWYVAAVVSWSIALFEYLLQVPANRIGFTTLSLAQLKIVQRSSRWPCSFRLRSSTCASRSSSTTSGP